MRGASRSLDSGRCFDSTTSTPSSSCSFVLLPVDCLLVCSLALFGERLSGGVGDVVVCTEFGLEGLYGIFFETEPLQLPEEAGEVVVTSSCCNPHTLASSLRNIS